MIAVRTGSRLHFGLLSLEADGQFRTNREGEPCLPARRFGGVGLMIEEPGLEVHLKPAEEWSANGPLAARALRMAQGFAQTLGASFPPLHLEIVHAPPEHVGLGTGTQLGMAIAHGLNRLWTESQTRSISEGQGLSLADAAGLYAGPTDLAALAQAVGRGQRSALGAHGFVHGGFLVEAGKSGEALAPLVARLEFPEAWRILLVIPARARGLHGSQEKQAFASLGGQPSDPGLTDVLCRLVLLGMLPALQAADCCLFGEALYDFNQRVGEAFASVQGGIYASEEIAAVVAFLRGQGIKGTGQSSWGPTVFAVVPDAEQAADLAQRLNERFGGSNASVIVTRAANRGAMISCPCPLRGKSEIRNPKSEGNPQCEIDQE